MASAIVPDATTKRVRTELVTSKDCIAIAADNTHTFPNGMTVHAGEELVFDLTACPKHNDLVLLWRDGGQPFVRCCEIAPSASAPRSQWCMGVLESDRDTIVMIDLRKYERIGVCTGRVNAEDRN